MVVLSRNRIFTGDCIFGGAVWQSLQPTIGEKQDFMGSRGGKFKPGSYQVNALTISKTKGTCNRVLLPLPYVYSKKTYYDYTIDGNAGASMESRIVQPPIPLLHKDVSVNKALAKLNKPDLDVGLILGEFSETLSMLRHPLSSLYPLVTDMRKTARSRHRAKPSQPFSKVLSSTWLEYCYGILPLLDDIQNVRDRFEKGVNHERGVLRRQASSTMREASCIVNEYVRPHANCEIMVSASAYTSKRVTTHIYYLYNDWQLEYERLTSWGVNPFQLLDVAYAITPYSFVVNWFWDIGTWLKAIQPHPQMDILGGCTTIKTVQSKQVSVLMGRCLYPTPQVWVPVNSTLDLLTTTLVREPQLVWSVPPTIGTGIDTISKAVNSAAMLWQRIPLKW